MLLQKLSCLGCDALIIYEPGKTDKISKLPSSFVKTELISFCSVGKSATNVTVTPFGPFLSTTFVTYKSSKD